RGKYGDELSHAICTDHAPGIIRRLDATAQDVEAVARRNTPSTARALPISGCGYNVLPHELSRHQEGWAADCHGQPFPSINSMSKIEQNTDGSYDLYCGLQLLACPPAPTW